MPVNALRSVQADHILTARDIGRLLASMELPIAGGKDSAMDPVDEDVSRIREDFSDQELGRRAGEITMFTCPDCGGTLWQSGAGDYLQFRCHVGHAWGQEALLGHKSEEIEAALWSSVRLFEERATLSRQVAARIRQSGQGSQRASVADEGASLDEQRADAIRQLLSASLVMPPAENSSNGEEDVAD
jgi:two-component system chemotaxis response regulator CheB